MMMSHDNDRIEVFLKSFVSSRSCFDEECEYTNQGPNDRKKTRDVTVEVRSNRKDNK